MSTKTRCLFFTSFFGLFLMGLAACSHSQFNRKPSSFFPLEAGLQRLSLPAEFLDAIVVLGDEAKSQSFCSGAFISDQGHILTASHCLDQACGPARIGHPRRKCRLILNGVSQDVLVHLSRSCLTNERDIAVNKRWEAMRYSQETKLTQREKICLGQPDVAILQILPVPGNEFHCLPADFESPPALGSEAATIGRPVKTSRSQGTNADGRSLYFSFGRILQGLGSLRSSDEAHCLVKNVGKQGFLYAGNEESAKIGEKIRLYELALKHSASTDVRLLRTSIDAVFGNSGGPLLQDGQIKGVFVRHFLNYGADGAEECEGATFFEPLTAIETLARATETRVEAQAFSCQEKRVAPGGRK